jgi:ferredoxin
VVRGFGIDADVERFTEDDEEIVVATISREASRRVPESRLHTALEAALNCEVRIVVGD